MKVRIQYAYEYGTCDVGDWIPGEVELTEEEAAIYNDATSRGVALEDVPELQDALDRALDEIEEPADGVNLFIEFCEPI